MDTITLQTASDLYERAELLSGIIARLMNEESRGMEPPYGIKLDGLNALDRRCIYTAVIGYLSKEEAMARDKFEKL